MSGYGTFVYGDGVEYSGDWQNDKPHGEGILTLGDGTKYRLVWNMGEKVSEELIE